MGLQTAGQRDQLFRLPVVLALAAHPRGLFRDFVVRVGKIEPQNVDLAVVGQKLCDLIAHILRIAAHIAALILLIGVRVVPAGMEHINGKVRVMPVDQRIIKAYVQPLGPESVHILPHQIAPGGSIGALVVGVLRVPHAEAFVMLGGQHRVLHPGGLRLTGPFPRVVQVGIKILKILVVFFLRDALVGLDPFVAGGHGVQAPMDKHTEAVVPEPRGIAGGFADDVAAHGQSSLLVAKINLIIMRKNHRELPRKRSKHDHPFRPSCSFVFSGFRRPYYSIAGDGKETPVVKITRKNRR